MLSNEMQPDNFAYNALRARQVSVMFLSFFLLSIPIRRVFHYKPSILGYPGIPFKRLKGTINSTSIRPTSSVPGSLALIDAETGCLEPAGAKNTMDWSGTSL